MTDTPEAVAMLPASLVFGELEAFASMPPEEDETWESWYYAAFDMVAESISRKANERVAEATHPTGNPYIDLDVGSITVPIGYVRKMVEAMQNTVDRGYVSSSIDEERGDHKALVAALKLGQSVITAFDQEAERG